uniref:Candidate secreted effector n=1 Tax=Meloidogyne incognita TaxID=6306 RepID=A0A914L1I8_MELIC
MNSIRRHCTQWSSGSNNRRCRSNNWSDRSYKWHRSSCLNGSSSCHRSGNRSSGRSSNDRSSSRSGKATTNS